MKRMIRRLSKACGRVSDKAVTLLIRMSGFLNIPPDRVRRFITPEKGRILIWVPLSSIKSFVPNCHLESLFAPLDVRKPNIPSFFWGGDWDQHALPVESHYEEYSVSYRSVIQIFNKGRGYRDSDEYREKLLDIERGASSVRAKNPEELAGYFESLLELERNIRLNGYRSQRELKGQMFDEIGVFIGRDGSLIKAEDKFSGTHRFALAKCIGVEKLPVCILAVHEQWAESHLHLLGNRKALENNILGHNE